MTSIRALHLEDDARDAELIARALQRAERATQATVVSDRPGFESALLSGDFNIVLCDYNIPNYDALAAIRFARENSPLTPIIMVSGHLGDERAVECIRCGATDYVAKDNLARLPLVVERALREAAEVRDRTAAEAALQQSHARLAHFFKSAPDAIIVTDTNGLILNVNVRSERLFGRQRAELVGQPVALLMPEFLRCYADTQSQQDRPNEEPVDTDTLQCNLDALHRDGSTFPIEANFSSIERPTGNAIAAVIRDASTRRANEQAERIKHAKLVAGIEAQAAYLEHGDLPLALEILIKCAIDLTESSCGFVGMIEEGGRIHVAAEHGLSETGDSTDIVFDVPDDADSNGRADETLGLEAALSRAIAARHPLMLRGAVAEARIGEATLRTMPVTSLFVAPVSTDGRPKAVFVLANFPGDGPTLLKSHPGSLLHQVGWLVERYLGSRREETLRAEREAAEGSAQQAFKILDATKDSIFIIDPETLAFTFVNDGTLKLLGYKRDEIMSLSPLAIFPPDQVRRFATLIGPMSRQGDSQVVRFTAPFRTNSGDQVPMEVTLQYVRPESGAPAFIAICRDMTHWERTLSELRDTAQKLTQSNELVERARDELAHRVEERTAELASTERLLRDMTNGLPGAAFQAEWTDAVTLKFNFVSAGFERLTGLAQSVILEDSNLLFERVVDEDRAHFVGTLIRAREEFSDCNVEFRMRHTDGSTIWTSSRSSPTRTGDRVLWNGYWNDITAERAAKQELEDARRSAMAASDAKSAFLATMSHEIRTPMNAVVGLIDLLMRDSLTDQHRQMISTMRSSTFALLHIIDDILDFSKIEAGRLDTETKPVSIPECLELVADMFALKAGEKGLDLELVIDPRLAAPVLSDGTRVRQILINLVGNAIKFTQTTDAQKGRVTIRARLAAGASDGDSRQLVVAVQDNGIGLEPEQLQAIFEPFIQAESSTTRRFGGTGLGLTISRRLAELMGGRIDVTSERHRGSTFTLSLPAESTDVGESERPLDGQVVLLIDPSNDPDNYYAQWLRHWGSTVSTIDLVDSAPDQIARARPGVVVLVSTTPDTTALLSAEHIAQLAAAAPLIVVGQPPSPQGSSIPNAVVISAHPFLPSALLGGVLSAARNTGAQPATPRHVLIERVAPSHEQAERDGTLILVAEDNPANQDVIGRQLELLGYAVDVADDGVDALELWRKRRYGLLLTDIHMPRCDGYELAAAIRRDQKVHVPIIALTADAIRGTLERARAAGIDDFVTKPVELKMLAAKLEEWLPLHIPNAAPEPAPPTAVSNDGIDFAEMSKFVGNDPAVQAKILQSFLRHAPASIDAMDQAFSGTDAKTMRSASHKLKSSARSIGASTLADACESLEEASGNDDWVSIERLFETMRPLYRVLESRIGDHLRRH